MNAEEIKALKNRVTALEAESQARKDQQLQYPLDYPSQQIIQVDSFIQAGPFVAATAGTNGYVPTTVNGINYKFMTTA